MRIERLETWAPPRGRIVAFRPTAQAQATAVASPVSPGEPSFLQQDHLNAYRTTVAAGRTHRAWTGTATHLSGPFDVEAMARALGRFAVRHEGLRTWFDLAGESAVRHLVAAGDVAFEAVEIEPPADWEAGWEELFVGLADEACRPDSWPPFVLAAVVHDEGASLFWACDHAFTDGASQLMVPVEIATAYAAETGQPSFELPEVGSFVTYAAEERERAGTYGMESPELQTWAEIVIRHEGRMPRFPLDLGLAPGETAPVNLRDLYPLTGDELAAFDRVCKEAGGRFTSGVFAALALTERKLTGAERYFGATVLGTRTGDYAMSHGWFCNFAPLEFEIPDGSFADAVVAAEKAYAVTKQLATMPVHVALGAAVMTGMTTPEKIGSPQLVSYLDLRKFPGVGLEVYDRGIHFTGVGRTGNASMWINREERRLQVGLQSPDTPQAQQAVDTFFAALAETFAEAVGGVASGAGSEVATDAGHHR